MGEITIHTGPQAFPLDLTQTYLLTHPHGIGGADRADRQFYVTGIDLDVSQLQASIKALGVLIRPMPPITLLPPNLRLGAGSEPAKL